MKAGSSAIFASSVALAVTLPVAGGPQSAAAQDTIFVSGTSGRIVIGRDADGGSGGPPLFRPGEYAIVRVCPADLLRYAYAIDLESAERLVNEFEIVGSPSRDRVAQDGDATTPSSLISEAADRTLLDLDTSHVVWYPDFALSLFTLERAVAAVVRPVFAIQNGSVPIKWGPAGSCDRYPAQIDDVRKRYGDQHEAVTSTLAELQGQLDERRAAFQTAVQLAYLISTSADARKLLSEFAQKWETVLAALDARLRTSGDQLQSASSIVDRWTAVQSAHPRPFVEQRFMIQQSSMQYTVQVTRKGVDAPNEKADDDENNEPAPSPEGIATISYQGRAKSRFNIGLGLAGVFRPRARSYEIVQIAGEGGAQHQLLESNRAGWDVLPVATFGVYVKGVDNFDPDRGVAALLTLGAELGGGWDSFLAGAAADFAQGFSIGGGVTLYEATDLEGDLEPGSLIPTNESGMPVISQPPLTRRQDIGWYISVFFRPAIFETLRNLVGGS